MKRGGLVHLHDADIRALEERANLIRQDIISMLVTAGSGHSAGPLGMADVFTALYFAVMKHDPKRPDWEERDRLVLSNGHICPVRYAAMAHAGYFPRKELQTLRQFGSRLQGHPERMRLPGLETTSGPLGSGSSQACGMALAGKMDKARWRVWCVMSDGELEEGQTWEAALFAGRHKLQNMTWIIDRNNIQIDGYTEDVCPLEPLREKFESFGFHVLEINGNDLEAVIDACEEARTIYEKPQVILAHTVPGRGVDYMEFDYTWHGKPPKAGAEADEALRQLRTIGGKIKSEHE